MDGEVSHVGTLGIWSAGRKQVQLNIKREGILFCSFEPAGTGGNDKTMNKAEDIFQTDVLQGY